MIPDPTLTDEELAEMEVRASRGHLFNPEIPRLIAAIKASRAEVEEWKGKYAEMESDWYHETGY